MDIRHDLENGVKFEGTNGKIFVTRDRIDLEGGAVDALYKNPVPESLLKELRKGKPVDGHMANFFECVRDRSVPVSDVWTHHRALTTCHLANIAIRLGRHEAHLGPRQGTDRRRLRGQRLTDPSPASPVRNRLMTRRVSKAISPPAPDSGSSGWPPKTTIFNFFSGMPGSPGLARGKPWLARGTVIWTSR